MAVSVEVRAFVSYRREDSSAWAGRLRDALAARFGPERVFQDVAAIGPGDSFDDAIDRALEQCEFTLVVIGPRWIETRGADGTSRLADPDDYVRRELLSALDHGQRVIPVLVGGAVMPAATALPPELRPLAQRQAVTLRDETWHADVDRLVGALAGVDTTRRRARLLFAVITVAAVVIAVTVAIVTLSRSPEDSGSAQTGDGATADGSTTTFNVNLTTLPICPSPRGPEWTALAWSGQPAPRPDARWDFEVLEAAYRPTDDDRWEVVVRVLATNLGSSTEVTIRHLPFYELLVGSEESGPATCFDVVGGDDDVSPLDSSEALVGFHLGAAPTGTAELAVDAGQRYRVELTATPDE